jgi:hypothetical protein
MGVIHYQNLEIGVSLAAGNADASRQLDWLRELEIAAAPEWKAYPVSGGEYQVSVLRYWSCPGERLFPLAEAVAKPSWAARNRFRSDMERVFDHGKLFAYIRGDAHWLVSETTGTILLQGWELIDAAPKKREEYFGAIDRTLTRYT